MRQIGDILRDAAVGAEFPAPTVIFGSNDRLSRRLLVALRQSVADLLLLVDGRGWSEQQSTWVFRLEAGRASYPLPPDYLAFIQDTDTVEGATHRLCGPVSADVFSLWRAGRLIPHSRYGVRVRMGRLYVEPVPSQAEVVTIDYLSRYPAMQVVTGWDAALWDGLPSDRKTPPFVTREGYLAVTPDDLGLTADEFDARFRLEGKPTGWDSSNDTDGDGYIDALIRKEFFTADTDYAAIDADLLLQDVTWRVRRAIGLPYAEEAALSARLRDALKAHDHGGVQDFCIDGETWRDESPPLPSTEPRLW